MSYFEKTALLGGTLSDLTPTVYLNIALKKKETIKAFSSTHNRTTKNLKLVLVTLRSAHGKYLRSLFDSRVLISKLVILPEFFISM